MRKFILWVVPLVSIAAVAWPAQAVDVTVHLDVDVVTAAPLADCDVSVPSGSSGLAVLDAAVANGCIESYETQTFGFGKLVTCINDLCQTPDETLNAVNWTVFVDGHVAGEGVSDLRFPADGTTLGFSYGPWAIYGTCFILGVACP
ncbi:MAG TPA: hypothetical protein VI916_14070 [Acidimicrobiia bacterium]|nr:hypothetical protein [Acidimicrobiia bacterium]